MAGKKLRQQIVREAARLLYQRQESEYKQAKVRAARTLCRQRLRPSELPTNHEIQDELKRLSSVYDVELATPGHGAGEHDPTAEQRFRLYRNLLVPLSRVQQDRKSHPEGDVLYHSLQVFRLACDALPYDEEFLLAALLHDVGKGIDPYDHIGAGLRALGRSISERTAWLIENHPQARSYLAGTLGIRARRRLHRADSYDELMLLAKCDAQGRVPGAVVPDLDEALDYIRDLAEADE
jgi:HD domain